MTLMLTAIIAFLVIGVLSPRFERQQEVAVVGLAILMVLLYYFFNQRFL